MRRALALAARARGRTAPNPMVGAVIVRDGAIVGEGYHHRAGEPHAEVMAIRAAAGQASGADLYVTLEPCCHHGRTSPCTAAVREAGIARVTAAMEDPNPRVGGAGARELAAAGLQVEMGLLEREARELNRAFIKHVTRALPYVTLKSAMTLDGKIAARTGDSRWVTGPAARRHAHRLRNWNDAVLVGSGTVRADDPLLTARIPGGRNPVRVIADTQAALSPSTRIAQTAREVPTLLACGEDAPQARRQALEALGIEILPLPRSGDGVDLAALMRRLASRDIMSVLVEGGAEISAALLAAGLVDRVELFIAPRIIGGRAAPGPVGGEGRARMQDAIPVHGLQVRRLGGDWWLAGDVHGDH